VLGTDGAVVAGALVVTMPATVEIGALVVTTTAEAAAPEALAVVIDVLIELPWSQTKHLPSNVNLTLDFDVKDLVIGLFIEITQQT
jgi:hypothetical protein